MRNSYYDFMLAEGATPAWRHEESAPWAAGSGKAERGVAENLRRRVRERAERRAAAKARRLLPVTAETEERSEEDVDEDVYDRAMSRVSGWFFMPPDAP